MTIKTSTSDDFRQKYNSIAIVKKVYMNLHYALTYIVQLVRPYTIYQLLL